MAMMTSRPLLSKLTLLVGFGFYCVPSANAETVQLTLEVAISRALAFSPQIKVAQAELLETKAKLAQARAARILPKVEGRVLGGVVPDTPEGAGPINNFPQVDTQLSDIGGFIRTQVEALQPLYTSGKIINLVNAAKAGVDSNQHKIRARQNEVIFQIKQVFHTLEFLYNLKDFLIELKDRGQQAYQKVEERIKKGDPEVTDIDLLRVSVFQHETDRNMIDTQNSLELADMTLKILMGLPETTTLDFTDRKIKKVDANIKTLDFYTSLAKTSRPEIYQIEYGVKAQDFLRRSFKSDFFPTFFLAGRYEFSRAPGRDNPRNPFLVNEFNQNFGGGAIGVQQNLSFHLTRARYKEELAKLQKAKAQSTLANQGIDLEIRKAYFDMKAKAESLESSEKSFKAGRSWVLASSLNFGTGLSSAKDLLESFLAYSKVKVTFYNTIREYNVALANLSKAVGEEISELKY